MMVRSRRRPLPVSEDDLHESIVQLATMRNWLLYHTHDSRRSRKGFPDLVLVRAPRVIFAELKSETGKPTPEQLVWLAQLDRCRAEKTGIEVYIWRPSEWDQIVEALR